MNFTEQEQQAIQFHSLANLPMIDCSSIAELAGQTKALFGHGNKAWLQTSQAITILRCINKQMPLQVGALFEMFGENILASFDDVKPLIQRNVINLLMEVFLAAQNVPIQPQIFIIFLPKLIIKSQQSELKSIREECLTCISNFIIHCGDNEAGLVAVAQFSADNKKPIGTQKFALQVFAKILQRVGPMLMQFTTQTLQIVMQAVCYLLENGKQEVQSYVFQIAMFLHGLVGDGNFRSWMGSALTPQQATTMIGCIQDHMKKKSKSKQINTLSSMKQRMTFGTYEQSDQDAHFREFVKDKENAHNFLNLNNIHVPPQQQYQHYQ